MGAKGCFLQRTTPTFFHGPWVDRSPERKLEIMSWLISHWSAEGSLKVTLHPFGQNQKQARWSLSTS